VARVGGPLAEQLDGVRLDGQRLHRQLTLPRDAKELPARHERGQVTARLEQARDDRRSTDDVLEVVDHEQQTAGTKVRADG
jgi:hypothetical protein